MRSWKVLLWRAFLAIVMFVTMGVLDKKDWVEMLDYGWWILYGALIMVAYERLQVGAWMERD